MRIDLHADDLGATRGVNENILAAWDAGALDSASIIANGDGLYVAVKAINSDITRRLRLVVHLNLSEGRSLIHPSRLTLLVDKLGRLRHGFASLWNLWQSSDMQTRLRLRNQIEVEWREQIKKAIEIFTPRCISAVDSHIHVHMLPFLFPIAARLATEFTIPEIRISNECYHFSFKESLWTGFPINILKHLLLNILARSARKVIKTYNLKSPDAIFGVLYSGHMSYETACAALKVGRQQGLEWIEILFHPGRASEYETDRWSGKPEIGRFYKHPFRDVERDALLRIAANKSQIQK